MSENFKCRPTDVMIKLDERNPAQDMFSVPFHCEKSLVLQLQQMRCFECRQLDYVSTNLCSCPSFVPNYYPGFWALSCLGSSPLDTSACAFMWSISAFGNKECLSPCTLVSFMLKKEHMF